MITYRSHLIAREGWPLIAITALIAAVLHFSTNGFIALPIWVAAAVLCVLFRDPRRVVPPKPLAIISPVDARVTAIDTVKDPYTQSESTQIQMRKGLFDVISTRSPMEGKIIKQWFKTLDSETVDIVSDGHDIVDAVASQTSASVVVAEPKVCFALWIQSDEQDNVVMVLQSASSIFKPRCYAHSGERVGQGQRCGFVLFNALVQVRVPVTSRVEVKVGDLVRAGSDTLATLVH